MDSQGKIINIKTIMAKFHYSLVFQRKLKRIVKINSKALKMPYAYNLKAVLKETGISPDVLRAWERRYGVPMPERTAGGHRLYSEHDIAMIKWLISRQNSGLSISRAVGMWKDHLAHGYDPLIENQMDKPRLLRAEHEPSLIYKIAESNLEGSMSNWLAACMNFNEAVAEQGLNQAFALFPVETVCVEVLQRGLAKIGGLWYENRASVQQEHFASALAMRRLNTLLSASPAPTRSETLIVGCPANEGHTFIPLLVSLFLRRRGFNVIYLGANIPTLQLVETVKAVKASVVVLASQQLITAASLQQSAEMISEQNVMVAFGGRIFAVQPNLATRVAGQYLGDRLESVVDKIESLLAAGPASQASYHPSKEYEDTLKAFIGKRAFIEASPDTEILTPDAAQYLATAHKFMGDNLIAALQLGEITLLDMEINWLIEMLECRNLPKRVVHDHLRTYSDQLVRQLGEHATLVHGWLNTKINSLK